MTNEQLALILMDIVEDLDRLEDEYLEEVPDNIERVTYTLYRIKPEYINNLILKHEHKEFFEQEEDYIPMPDIQSFIEKLKTRIKVLLNE